MNYIINVRTIVEYPIPSIKIKLFLLASEYIIISSIEKISNLIIKFCKVNSLIEKTS